MPNDQANPNPSTETPNPNPTNPSGTISTQPPAGNDSNARTATGEIIDQSTIKPEDKPGDKSESTVPESYTFASGEGQHLDEAAIGEVTPIFKELKLDQAGVDKLTGFYNKQVGAIQQRLQDSVNQMREGWRNEVMSDKEIGGKIEAVKADIGKMFTQMPPELVTEFKTAMDVTGVGDHPAVVKMLYKVAQLVNEGKPVAPGGPSAHGQSKTGSAAPASLASAMYPNLPQ